METIKTGDLIVKLTDFYPSLKIENNVKAIVANCNEDTFIYELLLAYRLPKTTIRYHHQLDLTVERRYCSTPFKSEEERLEHLFNFYERIIAVEGR